MESQADRVGQLVGVSAYKPKDHGFKSRLGHIPRLLVLYPKATVDVSVSHRCFSPSAMFLSAPLPCPPSKVNTHVLW